uniref:Secreted protein n=2 Tax=Oreochromis TaxID=8139 RepID=A0A669CX55_ORENI
MGSALGLASLTLSTWPFHCMPCTIFMALSRSSSFLKVTKANVCLPNSFILCGLRPCLHQFWRGHQASPPGRGMAE